MKNPNKYYNFRLTDEQQQLLKKLFEFLESDDEIFILKGYAGTGKTSIIHGLVTWLGENNRPFNLLASTGRSAKVLAEKARYPAFTVHSTIYALQLIETNKRKKNSDSPEYKIAFKLKMPNTNSKMLFFVDESSMLSNAQQAGGTIAFGTGRLLEDFFKYINNGKVVFIGDPAQLPPVNTKFSAALNKRYLNKTFGKKTKEFQLEKVMRYTEGSGIYLNTSQLRKTIMSGYYPMLSIKAHDLPDIKIHYHENDLIIKYYETIMSTGVDSAIYITFSNKIASVVNHKVRIHLWGINKSKNIQPGESLVVARNNYLFNLSNGDLITIDSVENKIETKAGLEFRHITIRVPDVDPKKGMVIKRVFIINDLLNYIGRDLSAEQEMALLNNFFGRMNAIATGIYEVLVSEQENDVMKNKIKSFTRKKSVAIDVCGIIEGMPSKKKLFNLLVKENMQTDPYLNALRVKYGYAITCHKAQGSEWPQIFLHLEKSIFFMDKENLHRWVYTALSRAEKKIHILNNICLY